MLWGAVPVSSRGSRVWQKKIPWQRPQDDSRIVQTEVPPQGGVARGWGRCFILADLVRWCLTT
ncbi:Ras Gtpase-Activating Protein-Binding Protein 1 [Manis pentadactyla]|nr:Ras Gtpase-Activating Protein-Binding Protein 1 [Manis pentadactyla]